MENDFYTNEDIQILTGINEKEAKMLINRMNEQLIAECEKYHLKPIIEANKVSKNYFIKRMEN